MGSMHKKTRDRLAADILDRVRNDRRRVADHEIRAFLGHLETHLWDTDLTIRDAYRVCGIAPKYFVKRFAAKFGDHPTGYVQELRLSLGEILLTRTGYSVGKIANLVGYNSCQAFSDAFKKNIGARPTAYRTRFKDGPNEESLLDKELCTRVNALNADQLQAFRDWFGNGESGDEQRKAGELSKQGQEDADNKDILDQQIARRIWSHIQGLTEHEQRNYVLAQNLPNPELFELLRSKSITEGRKNRITGIKLARLALDAAEVAERLDENLHSCLRARAWAWLGNAQRLILQLAEAERSFIMAEILLPPDAPQTVSGEIKETKAGLLWYQRKFDEALDLELEAIRLYKEAGYKIGTARALIVKAILLDSKGMRQDSMSTFKEVLVMLIAEPSSDLSCVASYNLAMCYVFEKDLVSARQTLDDLKERLKVRSVEHLWILVNWIEGRIALEEGLNLSASEHLKLARNSFIEIKSPQSSLVSLDLAITSLKLGDSAAALVYAGEFLSLLDVWKSIPEFEKIYKRLQRSISSRIISLDQLIAARDLCDRLRHEPEPRALLNLRGMA